VKPSYFLLDIIFIKNYRWILCIYRY